MVYRGGGIPAQNRANVLLLRTECKLSYTGIASKCNVSKSSVERICRNDRNPSKTFAFPKIGRPRKVGKRSLRTLARSFTKCGDENVNVTVTSLVQNSGLSLRQASRTTFSRRLNEMGYFFLQARKKRTSEWSRQEKTPRICKNNQKRLPVEKSCILARRDCLLLRRRIVCAQVQSSGRCPSPEVEGMAEGKREFTYYSEGV